MAAHKGCGRGNGSGKGNGGCAICKHPDVKEITQLMIGPIGDPEGKRLTYRDIRAKFHTDEKPVSRPSLSRHWKNCIRPALTGPADEQVTTRVEMLAVESFQGFLKRHESILAKLIDAAESALADPDNPGRYLMLGDGKKKHYDMLIRILDRSQKHIELIGKLEGRFKEPEDTSKTPDIQLAFIRQVIVQYHEGKNGEQAVIDIESVTPGSPLEQ